MYEILNDIKLYLPKYLSDRQQSALLDELSSFPKNLDKRFYSPWLKIQSEIFQGDAFAGVLFPDYERKQFRELKALLISNTCDSSLDNNRLYKPFISFTPIISLKKYEALLLSQHDKNKVSSHIQAIRAQKVTSFFFLPEDPSLAQDCFARLDQMFSLSLDENLVKKLLANRVFSLSNYGFYMLLFKLAIHLTRVQESLDRDSPVA